jgi:hypothetical protein
VLDNLTLAIEAGVVSEKKWLKQIFGDEEHFMNFLDELACYDDCYRICDRWHTALSVLAKSVLVEEGFIACSDISDELIKVAMDTKQLMPATKLC